MGSLSLLVTGHFANGQTRNAGIHWPGGVNPVELEKRHAQFLSVFRKELEIAPTLPNGMPKFTHIEIKCHVDGAFRHWAAIPLSAKAKDMIAKKYNNPRQSMGCQVIDLSRLTNPSEFWKNVRLYVDKTYKTIFVQ